MERFAHQHNIRSSFNSVFFFPRTEGEIRLEWSQSNRMVSFMTKSEYMFVDVVT